VRAPFARMPGDEAASANPGLRIPNNMFEAAARRRVQGTVHSEGEGHSTQPTPTLATVHRALTSRSGIIVQPVLANEFREKFVMGFLPGSSSGGKDGPSPTPRGGRISRRSQRMKRKVRLRGLEITQLLSKPQSANPMN